MLTGLRRLADRLIGLSAIIGAIGLLVEVVVILADVVGRYFGVPLAGAQDISQMTMVIVVFGGMALCDRLGGHISVDVFEPAFPHWLNRWTDIVAALLGAVIFAGIAWTVFESARLSQMLNLSTNIIGLPKYWFQWTLSAFALVTAFGMLLRAVEMVLRGASAPHGGRLV
ncbi:TRAP transporter small permease [Nitratireductor thuwali]|uniref:TRAP transporter small permease protein n=1 Tax=Nitratireductor thuwali TaxID=2267699 RepID=A0ABY5MF87_9HYPH|nr:hypothetical protein NTH_01146 [Nitratireductor thuwali]